MTWIDQIQPASFRGIPFFVDKNQTKGGRRVAKHQYPLRDQPYPEDLGDKGLGFTLDAYTIGDNALAARDALIVALRSKGPGTLIHPTFGTQRVQLEDWTVTEDLINEMRRCRFALTFTEAGDIAVPTVTADTTNQANTAATTATTANQNAFCDGFLA